MNARQAFMTLIACGVSKYVDRQILYALLPLIGAQFMLSDAQLGLVASAYMIAYVSAIPATGLGADRGHRPRWIASGVCGWNAATLATAAAAGPISLYASRAGVGLGVAAYSATAPGYLADLFPRHKRSRVLAGLAAAGPAGAALGYFLGGWIGHHWGWRPALLAAGLAGMALLPWTLRLEDSRSAGRQRPAPRDYLSLFKNASFPRVAAARALMAFALSSFAVWLPHYMTRYWGFTLVQAGTAMGAITVCSGILGTLLGGYLGDRGADDRALEKRRWNVSGAGLGIAAIFGAFALGANWYPMALAMLLIAETALFVNLGPLNAVLTSAVPAARHSMAFAALIFLSHSLGDALSPVLTGLASDRWGLRAAMALTLAAPAAGSLLCLRAARGIR